MLVSELSNINFSQLNEYSQKTEKKNTVEKSQSSKNGTLEETITEMAQKDATKGEYMGPEFAALRRNLVSKVSPNRSSAIAQVSNLMRNKSGYNLTDGINRWIATLFGLPYKAQGVNYPFGEDTTQIYDQNGEMIAAYHWLNGWTSVPTSTETKRSEELRFMYYDAYHKARQAIKAENLSTEAAHGVLFDAEA